MNNGIYMKINFIQTVGSKGYKINFLSFSPRFVGAVGTAVPPYFPAVFGAGALVRSATRTIKHGFGGCQPHERYTRIL